MLIRIILVTFFGVFSGSVAALATILFVELVKLGNTVFWSSTSSRQDIIDQPWLILVSVLVPALGGLIVGLLCMSSDEKRALNLADTIRSAQSLKYVSSLKSGLTTALASIVALGSGASVGQYGPVANLGGALGLSVSKISRSSGFTATMGLGCGVAAAIATAFNAPIAGLIFAHEVILRHYSLKSFAPITVASATGYIFANYIFNRPPIFPTGYMEQINAPEFLVFIAIGIGGAYIAMALMRLVLVAGDIAQKLIIPRYLKPAAAGAVLGIVAIWLPETLGIGESVMRNVLLGSIYSVSELAIILIAKLLLTALCLGFGFAGGIFSPTLLIGMLFGALVANLAPQILGEQFSISTAYIISGMMAVASPVIGAPLTAILIVFELTRNYDLTIAAMVSVVFANLVGYQLIGRSVFDVQLKREGFDLSLGRDKVVMDSRNISDFLSQNYISVGLNTSLADLQKMLINAEKTEGYVVSDGRYCGTITLVQIVALFQKGISKQTECCDVVSREFIVLYANTTIWSAMAQLQEFIGESVPVVSDVESDVLIGVVYEASILQAYMATLDSIRHEEHGMY